jgi:lysophospholipase L1-like esterase
LTSASTDFADGVYDSGNVVPGRQGLVTEEPGTGYAIFEVRSPYIIVPKVNRMETTEDDSEASVVELEGRGVTLSISLDDGATWRKVAEKAGDGRYDLTPHVAGRYQYLLRLDLENGPQSVVDKLEVTTWVQVAPASLPSLKSGRNRMELRLNDHYGLPSRVTTLFSETQRPEVLRRQVVALPEDYDPARHTGRIRGAVTAKLEAPPKTNIAWFTAEGSFRTHQGEAAAQTENTIAYATGSPEDFEEIYRSEVPTDMGHWHFNASREVKLDEPARKLFVRFDGDPAVNHFRLFAHCIEERHRPSGSVVVTHRWTDGEGPKQKTVTLREMGSYVVEAGADPVEESLEIRVPSDAGNHAATKPTESESEVAGPPENASEADWVAPMRRVHERFTGEPGTFAQFGDSITDSRAFWTSLRWNREGASPAMLADFRVVQEHMLEDCWDRKGAEYGNQSGQTIRWASKHLDEWLERWNPEAAILMFGTNDLNNVDTEDYRATLEEVVRRCLDHGTVVIVSTIPPRHGFEEKSADFAEAARHVAENLHVPLVDFHAAILERRPDDWDGADEKFREYKGYDVPTLIARDGVHPSNPKQYRGHYSEEALRNNGFSLRNYLVLRKYAEVIRRVLEPKGTP